MPGVGPRSPRRRPDHGGPGAHARGRRRGRRPPAAPASRGRWRPRCGGRGRPSPPRARGRRPRPLRSRARRRPAGSSSRPLRASRRVGPQQPVQAALRGVRREDPLAGPGTEVGTQRRVGHQGVQCGGECPWVPRWAEEVRGHRPPHLGDAPDGRRDRGEPVAIAWSNAIGQLSAADVSTNPSACWSSGAGSVTRPSRVTVRRSRSDSGMRRATRSRTSGASSPSPATSTSTSSRISATPSTSTSARFTGTSPPSQTRRGRVPTEAGAAGPGRKRSGSTPLGTTSTREGCRPTCRTAKSATARLGLTTRALPHCVIQRSPCR